MKSLRTAFLAFLAAAVVVTAPLAQKKSDLDEAMSFDGLEKVKVKDIDLVYARPGTTLAAYNRIKLEPVEVSFHKDWDPTKTGSRLKLSPEERENIRSGVAKVVYDEFARTLQAKDAYKLANDAAPDVLRVKARIRNLYVNAPDVPTAGRSRTYTVSAGEMTLFMELYDSETGAVLARVVDRREARNTGMMQLSSSVVNASEARMIASEWARVLKNGLDKAHGIGKK